jgi:hypothetical protein
MVRATGNGDRVATSRPGRDLLQQGTAQPHHSFIITVKSAFPAPSLCSYALKHRTPLPLFNLGGMEGCILIVNGEFSFWKRTAKMTEAYHYDRANTRTRVSCLLSSASETNSEYI